MDYLAFLVRFCGSWFWRRGLRWVTAATATQPLPKTISVHQFRTVGPATARAAGTLLL